jgi:ADP-dependent phosphofructokinase/glucokinase
MMMQSYLTGTIDLLSVPQVVRALADLHVLIPAHTLVLHTQYWALAYGDRAGEYAPALDTGTVMATTRYVNGDEPTDEDVAGLRRLPRRSESEVFAAALQQRLGDTVRCAPGFAVDAENPTTVGLGDTLVGGFLSAVALFDVEDPHA